jgi:hypothetical protein
MSTLFKKLNLGTHTRIQVLNAPPSFETELAALKDVTVARTASKPCGFGMAFVITEAERDGASRKLAAAAAGDAVLWMVYPKQTSKRYRCEFNRDSGWKTLAAAGFEPVRMVAVDEDWSALRFRRVEHIKVMTRSRK